LFHRWGFLYLALVILQKGSQSFKYKFYSQSDFVIGTFYPTAVNRLEQQVGKLLVFSADHFSLLTYYPFGTSPFKTNQSYAVVQFEQNFLFKWLLSSLFQLFVQSFGHFEQF
jgi:hypothetical protein